MTDDERRNPNQGPELPLDAAELDELVGAYLLDALSDEDRAEFERHLAESTEARAEVAHLRPVADLLGLAVDDPGEIEPSLGLRDRILQAVASEPAPASQTQRSRASSERQAAAPAPAQGAPRTSRRPSPAGPRTARDENAPPGGPARLLEFVRSAGYDRLAAAVLALVAAAALIWAFTLQGRLSDRNGEIDDLRGQLAAVSTAENAPVQAYFFRISPTPEGPEGADGVLFFGSSDSTHARLDMNDLPAPAEGHAYQLWFLDVDANGQPTGSPRPSVTFPVDESGSVSIPDVPVDQPFGAVAITEEPVGGSTTPTAPILFLGTPGTAQG